MKTVTRNRKMYGWLIAVLLVWVSSASVSQATWTSIQYDNLDAWGNPYPTNWVNNAANTDGYYYTSTKPGTGAWTFHYEFRPVAQAAGWTTLPMSVWSANNAWFHTFSTSAANGGAPADVQLKVVLSEPIIGAAWIPKQGLSINSGSAYLEYSTNGADWITTHTYTASGMYEGTAYNLSFPTAVSDLYLRLRTDATAYDLVNGDLTFFTIPEPMTTALLGVGLLICLLRRKHR